MITKDLVHKGELISEAMGRLFDVNVEGVFWFVEKGAVDLFLKNTETLCEIPFMHIQEGEVFFGAKAVNGYVLNARQVIFSRVYQVKLEEILDWHTEIRSQFISQIDNWVEKAFKLISVGRVPSVYYDLNETLLAEYPAQSTLSVLKMPCWVKILSGSAFINNDTSESLNDKSYPFPVSKRYGWIVCDNAITLQIFSTEAMLSSPHFAITMANFCSYILKRFIQNYENKELAELLSLSNKLNYYHKYIHLSIDNLSDTITSEATTDKGIEYEANNFDKVMECLYQNIHVPFQPMNRTEMRLGVMERFFAFSTRSKIFYRPVLLENSWYKSQHGPLFAVTQEDDPIALIPQGEKYYWYDGYSDQHREVNAEFAKTLKTKAYSIFKPFPSKMITLKNLIYFGLSENKKTLWSILATSSLVALLSLLTPILLQKLFDKVVPYAEMSLFYQLTLILAATLIGMTLIGLTRGFFILILETKIAYLTQSALWDRLIKLPTAFFKNYSAGDLVSRANGIQEMHQLLRWKTLSILFSSIFTVFSLLLMFYYQATLAMVSLGFIASIALLLYGLGKANIQHIRKSMALSGLMYGFLGEVIDSITKIRSTASESRFFYLWSKKYTDIRRETNKSTLYEITMEGINGILPLMSTIMIFASIYYLQMENKFTLGVFLAFNAAYGQLMGGVINLVGQMIKLLDVIPLYERVKPILHTLPETTFGLEVVDNIEGKIELTEVSFKYAEDKPYILENISLKIEPGDYIAVVGASGAGKSTLLRLLLNFDVPTSGTLFFDNVDRTVLDLDYYRSQIGVVLQNDHLVPESIYANIAGTRNIPEKVIWETLKKVNLAEDIVKLPQQLHTLVGQMGMGLSGGQRQRLMIARALVHNPKVLFLDEATNSLDNISQRYVVDTLKKLKITRFIIAHRLTTIENVDKIIVLKEGKIIEQGTYKELMDNQGYFYDLAQAQA